MFPARTHVLSNIFQLLAAAVLLLVAIPAIGQVPLTPDGFTNHVAGVLNADRPPAPIRVVAPLTLEERTPTGQRMQLNLDRIYALCRTDQGRCPEIVAAYASQARMMLRQSATSPTLAGLRVAIRPENYVRNLPGAAGVPASSQSLPPGLVALIYMDEPTSMRLLSFNDLQALRLSDDQAFATALQNTSRALPPLDQVIKPLLPGQIDGFRGGAYESSRLLLLADWSKVAAQFGGRLLVAIPSADELLYANGAGSMALPRLSALAHTRFAQAERPTSASVFEWRSTGWVAATP